MITSIHQRTSARPDTAILIEDGSIGRRPGIEEGPSVAEGIAILTTLELNSDLCIFAGRKHHTLDGDHLASPLNRDYAFALGMTHALLPFPFSWGFGYHTKFKGDNEAESFPCLRAPERD